MPAKPLEKLPERGHRCGVERAQEQLPLKFSVIDEFVARCEVEFDNVLMVTLSTEFAVFRPGALPS